MALLTAKQIASLNVGLLARSLVLPSTVLRVNAGEMSGPNGETITVRVPAVGTARTQATRSATITYDDITETGVDVSIDHYYHGKLVSDEEMSFDVENFGAQISAIQVEAVARKAEDALATVMNGLASEDTFALSASDADTEDTILAARETLSEANVPSADRFLAVSPQIATRLLSVDKFVKVNEAGSSDALRNAVIGRLYGFTIVESNALTAGTAVAYHRSSFVFANKVPMRPRGAVDSATASYQGIGLRHIFQYVPDKLSDASVVSTFAGANTVDGNRCVKLTTATV